MISRKNISWLIGFLFITVLGVCGNLIGLYSFWTDDDTDLYNQLKDINRRLENIADNDNGNYKNIATQFETVIEDYKVITNVMQDSLKNDKKKDINNELLTIDKKVKSLWGKGKISDREFMKFDNIIRFGKEKKFPNNNDKTFNNPSNLDDVIIPSKENNYPSDNANKRKVTPPPSNIFTITPNK